MFIFWVFLGNKQAVQLESKVECFSKDGSLLNNCKILILTFYPPLQLQFQMKTRNFWRRIESFTGHIFESKGCDVQKIGLKMTSNEKKTDLDHPK